MGTGKHLFFNAHSDKSNELTNSLITLQKGRRKVRGYLKMQSYTLAAILVIIVATSVGRTIDSNGKNDVIYRLASQLLDDDADTHRYSETDDVNIKERREETKSLAKRDKEETTKSKDGVATRRDLKREILQALVTLLHDQMQVENSLEISEKQTERKFMGPDVIEKREESVKTAEQTSSAKKYQ